MSKPTDGWHKVHQYEVYVENGYVKRAVKKDHNGSRVTAYPYKYNQKQRASVNVSGEVKLETLRKGLKDGPYSIQ